MEDSGQLGVTVWYVLDSWCRQGCHHLATNQDKAWWSCFYKPAIYHVCVCVGGGGGGGGGGGRGGDNDILFQMCEVIH